MALQTINPTKTKAWQELEKHFQEAKQIVMQEMFQEDASRAEKFHIKWDKFLVDYSKNRINQKTIDLLLNLAKEIGLKEAINSYFSGENINQTEDRAVLHTALRVNQNETILVNNKKTKASYKIQEKDEVIVEEDKPKEVSIKAQNIPIEILYEDNDIIVVNKPKGLVVHPANGNPDGTLVNAIMAICKGTLSGIGGELRPGIVHRLDKDTSGVLIVAKNDIAHVKMSEQIKKHEVEKTYIALVKGIVKENQATINMPIGRSTKDRKKMAVNKKGKEAITHFKVIERFPKYNCTLLEIKIETGRTHQIRVHLSEIGYPVIGDEVYSNGKNQWNIKGQCLHAKSLKFKHPVTKKEMFIEAELPKYFKDIIEQMRQRGTGL